MPRLQQTTIRRGTGFENISAHFPPPSRTARCYDLPNFSSAKLALGTLPPIGTNTGPIAAGSPVHAPDIGTLPDGGRAPKGDSRVATPGQCQHTKLHQNQSKGPQQQRTFSTAAGLCCCCCYCWHRIVGHFTPERSAVSSP